MRAPAPMAAAASFHPPPSFLLGSPAGLAPSTHSKRYADPTMASSQADTFLLASAVEGGGSKLQGLCVRIPQYHDASVFTHDKCRIPVDCKTSRHC